MRRLAVLALLALAGLVLLGGCGHSPIASQETPGPPPPDEAQVPGPSASAGASAGVEVFEDVTARAGIDFTHSQSVGGKLQYIPEIMGSGCAMVDYDGDGQLDLFFVQGSGPTDGKDPATRPTCKLYRNKGDGTFEDVTHKAGLDVSLWGQGCLWFDYDNDGLPDLLITCFHESNRLFHQLPDHTFKDVTKEAGLYDPSNVWSSGAAAIDFDRDGFLDLYICGYLDFRDKDFVPDPQLISIQQSGKNQPSSFSPFSYEPLANHLYRNTGKGTFEDVTARAGVADKEGKSLTALVADFDGDGWPDLFIANDVTPKALYINQHNGTFRDEARTAWVADIHGSMGLAAGDIDGDGQLDVFCTHWISEANAMYRNNSGGALNKLTKKAKEGRKVTFTEISEASGIAETALDKVGWGCSLVDVDRDGLQDIVYVNGHTFLDDGTPRRLIPQPGALYFNGGDRTFRKAVLGAGDGLGRPRVARGLAVGDFDGDGYPDLLITQNNGPAALLRHRGGQGTHWLGLHLVGTRSNRDAVGAVARVKAGTLNMVRPRLSGDSFMSSSSPILLFGLGGQKSIDALTVRWPSGQAESFPPPAVDAVATIREGSGTPAGS